MLGVPAPLAVGTALLFGSGIKLVALPTYILRKQVDYGVLAWLVAGGLPGALIGSVMLGRLSGDHSHLLYLLLGATIVLSAGWNVFRAIRPREAAPREDRRRWLAAVALPIGAEVGFSSAGAGALGSAAIMSMTSISPGRVVGTDVFFGLVLSIVAGGVHSSMGHFDGGLLVKLLTGGLVGALIGANTLAWLPARPLRVALSLWLVSIGGQLLFRAWP
jgi:uncharacterized membrane protein YfcA